MSRTSPVQDDQTEVEPRRGGRVRKQVERFEPPAGKRSSAKKRKDAEEEDEDDDDSDEQSEAESEEARPARKKRAGSSSATEKAGGAQKKARKNNLPKTVNGAAEGEQGNAQIKNDCPLFNALVTPNIALKPIVEEWVDIYQQTAKDETSERASVHELILLIIRCCGLNADLEEDEAMDVDGILDALERIQDESLQSASAMYPLIARTKEARTIKTNLETFIPHFIKTLSLTPLLYHTPETTSHSYPILQLVFHWLHSMSSSTLRPIRHTATHFILKICSALCDIAAGVSSELSLKQRQREAAEKKGGQGPAAKKKLAELVAQVQGAEEKKQRLREYLEESFNIMFVHRVRDLDPLIRTECLKELGVWAETYGELYINNNFLTYFSRGCNDPDPKARLETAKALPALLSTEYNTGRARSVMIRLAPRLIEMAIRDVDVNVRIHALALITEIDKRGIVEDEDDSFRLKVSRLIFDNQPKIRKAVGSFFRGVWEQRVSELNSEWKAAKPAAKKRAGKATEAEMESRFGYKALATLLVETAQSVDAENDQGESSKQGESSNAALAGRATAAVEALWDVFEELEQWEDLVEYLLLDHSQTQDIWILDEDEESLLLQILVACIRRDDRDGEEEDERTKTLINVLPRLYVKHQADSDRMKCLLAIPREMKLSLYQDMGKGQAYEALWDDVTKQFLDHTDSTLLKAAIVAIVHLSSNSAGETANNVKFAELDETVFASLRDTINGAEVSSMAIDEDRLIKLEAILLRISLLQRSRDLTNTIDDEEGGQSSGWDIVCAFAERGEVGYKEEAKMVEHAIQIIFLHLTWLFKKFSKEDGQIPERVVDLKLKRDKGKEIFERLALNDRSNVADHVRKQAFIAYLNLHILFSDRNAASHPAAEAVPMKLEDHIQTKLENAFKGIVERHALDREDHTEEEQSLDSVMAGPQMLFLQLVSVLVAAIRCSVVDVVHAQEPLSHFGRFGRTYDAIVKRLVDPLRDEGIYNGEATTVQATVCAALQNSFDRFLDTDEKEPHNTIALAKFISTAFIVQGNHFVVLKQIHPDEVEDLHKSCIQWLYRRLTQATRSLGSAKGKAAVARAESRIDQMLTFFRALVNLLGPISGKQALEIKRVLEETIRDDINFNQEKHWDAYRAYEKRLNVIAGKDPKVRVVTQKTKMTADVLEDTDAEDEIVVENSPTKRVRKRRIEELEEIETAGGGADGVAMTNGATGLDAAGDAREEEENGDEEAALEADLELDMDFELDLPDTQDVRLRSPSLEPAVKRRRTERRF